MLHFVSKSDFHVIGFRVADDVGQGLLNDSEQGCSTAGARRPRNDARMLTVIPFRLNIPPPETPEREPDPDRPERWGALHVRETASAPQSGRAS